MQIQQQTITGSPSLSSTPTSASWNAFMQDQPGQPGEEIIIRLYPELVFQELQGVGGAFSEIGWRALTTLPVAERHSVMRALFAEEEAGFSYCRLPIGASDFMTDAYSLNDTADDYAMAHFSLRRDEQGLIPFIQAALQHAPALRLHASPWSPPGWLKTTGRMVEGGTLIAGEQASRAYALYLLRFLTGYAAHGIHINRLFVQNEPDVTSNYPSCLFAPERMVDFTANYLAPLLHTTELPVEIWGGTFRMVLAHEALDCLQQALFRDCIAGLGFQYCIPEYLYELRQTFPQLGLMHTESVCYNGDNTWEQAEGLFHDIIRHLHAGCDVYSYWNMVLDEQGCSGWGWRQNSLVTIQRETGQVTLNPDYHIMRLFSTAIRPGAQRIAAFSSQRSVLAVRRADGTMSLLVGNRESTARRAIIVCEGETIPVELPPSSFSAIQLRG